MTETNQTSKIDLRPHDIESLLSLVRWQGNLIAVATGVVGTTGSGVLIWATSHEREMVGDWWAGEDVEKAIAAIFLFIGFLAVHYWNCNHVKKLSDSALKILVDNEKIDPSVAKLFDGGPLVFNIVLWGPILLLLGILMAVLI